MTLNRSVIDAIPDPVVLLDHARNVVYANTAARDLLDCRQAGGDLAMSVRHPVVLDAIDRVLAGAPSHTAEISLPVPMARTFQLHATRVSVTGHESPINPDVIAVVMFRDMTTAVRAEQMRVDFVNNASHELRSPLSAILGFIETLKGPAAPDDKARERFLGIMSREAERMRRLIEDLLSLSKVEANEHVRPRTQISLIGLIEGVADSLDPRIREFDMDLRFDIPDDLPGVIGDEGQLTQVFRNIIENAIVHGRRGTIVNVAMMPVARLADTGRPGVVVPGVVVMVHDQGAGIPADAIPRLTERFYRVDKARSPGNSGKPGNPNSTGLGLAIVKHIINRHRGRLRIESVLGKGSTFSVYLPSE